MHFQAHKNENEVSIWYFMFIHQLFHISEHWTFEKTVASAILVKRKKDTYPRDEKILLPFLNGGNWVKN
jgi:hypothetical protein